MIWQRCTLNTKSPLFLLNLPTFVVFYVTRIAVYLGYTLVTEAANMLAFVLVAMFAGMMTSIATLMLGSSIWAALTLYMVSGTGILLLVLVRAFICNIVSDLRGAGHSPVNVSESN